MRRTSNNHYAYATLSPLELNEMTGSFMMGFMIKLTAAAQQHEGNRKFRRESDMMHTDAGIDVNRSITPR